MSKFRVEIEAAAARYKLNPDLVEAVVMEESSDDTLAYRYEPGFWKLYLAGNPIYDKRDPKRVSASYGLMQVIYPTAVDEGYIGYPEGLCAPEVGLDYGCKLLASDIEWAGGDVGKALAAYNGGRGDWSDADPQQYASEVLLALGKITSARQPKPQAK